MIKLLQKINYRLVGYDCPLKRYPSPAIPIVLNLFGKYKAVYLNDNLELETEPVVATANFYKLANSEVNLQKKLENFDYRKHRLFAISENNVEFYEVIDEIYFFIKLLIDKDFSKNDQFARVLLAEAIGINKILSKELQMYKEYLQEHQKNLLPFWNEDEKDFERKLQQDSSISSLLMKIPTTGEKASTVGLDYTNLRNLLRDKKEEEADQETEKVILNLNEKVTKQEIKGFPVIDLHTIDKLWLISSGGESGFSIQKRNGRRNFRPKCEGCDDVLINAVLTDFDSEQYLEKTNAGLIWQRLLEFFRLDHTLWNWDWLVKFLREAWVSKLVWVVVCGCFCIVVININITPFIGQDYQLSSIPIEVESKRQQKILTELPSKTHESSIKGDDKILTQEKQLEVKNKIDEINKIEVAINKIEVAIKNREIKVAMGMKNEGINEWMVDAARDAESNDAAAWVDGGRVGDVRVAWSSGDEAERKKEDLCWKLKSLLEEAGSSSSGIRGRRGLGGRVGFVGKWERVSLTVKEEKKLSEICGETLIVR